MHFAQGSYIAFLVINITLCFVQALLQSELHEKISQAVKRFERLFLGLLNSAKVVNVHLGVKNKEGSLEVAICAMKNTKISFWRDK